MALHGMIEVNAERIGEWAAVNRGHVTAGEQDPCRYDWCVSLAWQAAHGELEHRRSAGAVALAAAVLAASGL